jgi:hypothetical protein
MQKLRKMLGNWHQPEIQSLVKLIETQSKITIVNWCLNYAEKHYLPIYEAALPNDQRPRVSLDKARAWLQGKIKLPEVKKAILECHAAARETEKQPILQAAARAIGQAASSVHAATHALGIAFYGAAVIAYSEAGLEASADEYDKIASTEFINIYNSLKEMSVENEPNPAKVSWNC